MSLHKKLNLYKITCITAVFFSFSLKARPIISQIHQDFMAFLPGFHSSDILRSIHLWDKLPLSATPTVIPWGGSSWPWYLGSVAFRYNEGLPFFVDSFKASWALRKSFYKFKNKHPRNYKTLEDLKQLSPAEKYDLLFDDSQRTFSHAVFSRSFYFNASGERNGGEIVRWAGLCDGLAAASMQYCRPKKTVIATSLSGKKIPFLPSDIKALASLLWQTGDVLAPSTYLGKNCPSYPETNFYKQRQDRRQGKKNTCYDLNAADFFFLLTHRTGLQKKSFALEIYPDYKKSNHALRKYSLSFFNPKTKEVFEKKEDLQKALVLYKEVRAQDFWQEFRATGTHFLLGVSVTLELSDYESYASRKQTDALEDDKRKTVSYSFDLEIDARGIVLGGEWQSTTPPDFIWADPFGKINSGFDHLLKIKTFSLERPLPYSFKKPATQAALKKSSTFLGMPRPSPLSLIVEELFKVSCD